MAAKVDTIAKELKIHVPLTAFGTVTCIMIMAVVIHARTPKEVPSTLFRTSPPLGALLIRPDTELHVAHVSEGTVSGTA